MSAARDERPMAPRRGYTLVELLVAMSILVLLGGGLVTLLRQGITLWSTAENRGRVLDQGRLILDRLAADLRSTVIRSHQGDDNAWIRFICDRDKRGAQRLRFVRTISGETEDPLLREAGKYLHVQAPAVYDGFDDAREAKDGRLGAPGGILEVLYARDPRPASRLLWRGVRTPVGGMDSLFNDSNLEKQPAKGSRVRRTRTRGESRRDDKEGDDASKGPAAAPAPFEDVARPLTDGVLYLGFHFWGPTTDTWSDEPPAKRGTRTAARKGPLTYWDSTRALLDSPAARGEFAFEKRDTSLNDPSDDIFPEMVEVTVVLAESPASQGAVLSSDLLANGKTFVISQPLELADSPRDRYFLIDDEWIQLEAIEGRKVTVARDGRGARETKAATHAIGTPIDVGLTLRRVVSIPGHRRLPGEDAGDGRRRR